MAITPASIRNKNPGAMYPGPSARKFGSRSFQTLKSHDGVHKIATFPSDVQGAAALFDLLSSPSYANGQRTLKECITKWCGGYYVGTYLKVLEEKAGISADSVLTRDMLADPTIAVPIGRAMAWQEAGRDYPLDEAGWAQGHALAFPTAAPYVAPEAVTPPEPLPPVFQPENPLPSPKPETRVQEAAKGSGTIKGAIGAFVAWVATQVEAAYQAITGGLDKVNHLVGQDTTMTLISAHAKKNVGALLGMMFLAGLALVVIRRLSAAQEGKQG